jgi:hypothetical protein
LNTGAINPDRISQVFFKVYMIFSIHSLKQPAILQRLRTSETEARLPTFLEEPEVMPVLPEVQFGWDAGTMLPPFSTSLLLKESGFSHEMNN